IGDPVIEPEPRLPDELPAVPGTAVGGVPETDCERPRDYDVRGEEAGEGHGPGRWPPSCGASHHTRLHRHRGASLASPQRSSPPNARSKTVVQSDSAPSAAAAVRIALCRPGWPRISPRAAA